MSTRVLGTAAATCLYVQASKLTWALQRGDLGLALSLPYKHFKLFHRRVTTPQLASATLSPSLLSQRIAEWLLLFTGLMPPWNAQLSAACCSPTTKNLKGMVNFGNTETEQAQTPPPPPPKHPLIHSPHSHLPHHLCTLNTREQAFP